MKRRLLAVLLAWTMVLTMMPVINLTAFAASSDNEPAIELAEADDSGDVSGDAQGEDGLSWADEAKELAIGATDQVSSLNQGEKAYYKITVSEDGTYVFGTKGNNDTYGILYNSDGTANSSNDDDGPDSNFMIRAELSAGEVYYLAAYGYAVGSVTNMTVYAMKALTVKCSDDGEVTAKFSEDTTLTVTVPEGQTTEEITYQWYYDDMEIEGANDSSYTIKAQTYPDAECEYYCEVTAGLQNAKGEFTVTVEGAPEVSINTISAEVQYDESLTLTVTATDPAKAGITYQWYCMENADWDLAPEKIEGATKSSYTIPAKSYIAQSMMYYCKVTIGDYTVTKDCLVNVTSLTVSDPGQAAATLGSKTTLKLNASSSYSDQLTYTWKEIDSTGEYLKGTKTTTGEYTYTVTPERTRGVYVRVSDGFSYVDITLEPEITGTSPYSMDMYLNYTEDEDTITITSDISWYLYDEDSGSQSGIEDPGLNVTYSWYKYTWNMETGEEEYLLMEGEHNATLSVDASARISMYKCVLNAVDTKGLACVAAANTVRLRYYDSDSWFNDWDMESSGDRTWGETLTYTFGANVEKDDTEDITYQWYASGKSDEEEQETISWKKIEGATTDTYSTVLGADTPEMYLLIACHNGNDYCGRVCYTDAKSVKINSEDSADFHVRYGKGTTLSVDAESMIEGAKLSYQWMYKNTSTNNCYTSIPGAIAATYEVPASLLTGEETVFVCTVSDGNSKQSIYMYVYIYRTKVTIERESSKVTYGKAYTVTANVTGDTTNIQYKWYLDDVLLSGCNTATCTVPANKLAEPDSGKELECKVTVGDADDTYTATGYIWLYTQTTLTLDSASEYTVNYGESVSLTADASTTTDNAITYQWYQYDEDTGYKAMEGETNSVLKVSEKDTVVHKLYYRLVVSDQAMEISRDYTVSVNVLKDTDHLYFKGKGEVLTLDAGTVDTTANVSRQWMRYSESSDSYVNIDGATGETFAITEDALDQYACQITVGSCTWIEYYSINYADTLAVLRSERNTDRADEVKMSVTAVTNMNHEITYQWQIAGEDDTYTDISGANSDALTVKASDLALVDGCLAYRLIVSDGTTTTAVDFNDEYNPFTWSVEGSDIPNLNYYSFYDEEAVDTISVNVRSILEGDISYQWYYDDDDSDENSGYTPIEGATGSSVKLQEEWNYNAYSMDLKCRITQGSCSKEISFYLDAMSSILIGDYSSYVKVKRGDQVTLKIDASSKAGKALTYSWSYYNEFCFKEALEGEESNSLTLDTSASEFASLSDSTFYVTVSDGTDSVTRSIYVVFQDKDQTEDLAFTTDDWTVQRVLKGQPVTLTAELKDSPSGVSYQWYRYTDDNGEYTPISGANGNSYNLQTDNEKTGNVIAFECVATSGTHTGSHFFQVYVEDVDTALTENQVATINNQDCRIVSFTPSESGTYTFETLNAMDKESLNYTNKRIILYHLVDGHLKKVSQVAAAATEDSDMFTNVIVNPAPNLDLQCELTAGETYCFKVAGSGMLDSALQVVVHKGETALYNDYVEVDPEDAVTLSVPGSLVTAGDSFHWYLVKSGNMIRMSGATQNITVTAPEVGCDAASYRCIVAKADGSSISLDYKVKYSTIQVPEGTKTGEGYVSFKAEAGETVVLDAASASTRGRELTYTWNMESSDVVSMSAEGSVCTVKVSDDLSEDDYLNMVTVTCIVDDGYFTRTIEYTLVDIYNLGYGGDFNTDYWEETETPAPSFTATLPEGTWTYDGTAKTPEPVVVSSEGETLVKGTDYNVNYENNTEVGTAMVYVYGLRSYSRSSETLTFTIGKANIGRASVSTETSSYTYTGSALKPAVKVVLGGKTLTSGTDYTVAYSNNTNVGTAEITVTGKGNYTGTLKGSFSIVYPLATPSITKVANTATGMKVTWGAVTGAAKYRVFYKTSSGWTKLADTTSTSYSFTKLGTKALTAGTTYTFTVRCIDSTGKVYTSDLNSTGKSYRRLTAIKPTLANTATGIKLSWTKVKGATGYLVYRKTGSGTYAQVKKITANATVTYTDTAVKAKNGTTYTYLVKAYYGTSYGSYTAVTLYRITAPAFTSLTNVSGKKMTAKWGKNTKATGYEVMYSLKSNFASGNKTVTIKKNTTVTTTIASLTKGKTYYVQIRAYKTVGSTKYYSCWCTKKSVKIAK